MFNSIKVDPCKNNVGAFIDIKIETANAKSIEEIKIALDEYGVVFFRNQNLNSASYISFAKQFGQCADYPMLRGLDGFPEITVVEKKPDENIMFGEGWHTDSTYTQEPHQYTMLYSIKTPPKGKGNTLFASQYESYKKLPEEYKKKIENLKAVFSADCPISKTRNSRLAEKGTGIDPKTMFAIHPIVKENRNNKKKSIYLSPGHVTKIVDMGEEESKTLLDYLFQHQSKPEFIYGFEWEPNCLAIWSNHVMLHNPANDFTGIHRVMHRITIQ